MIPRGRFGKALLESPHLPIALYLGLLGVAGIITGTGIAPSTLQQILPHWMVFVWTGCVAVGGIAATAGVFEKRTRVESIGLALLAWGALMYGAAVTIVAYPHGFTAAAVSAAVMSMCLIRMRALSLARKAIRLATEILDARDL